MLQKDPEKRIRIHEILKHKWMDDIEEDLEIFNDQEKQTIIKQFTFSNRKIERGDDENEAADCFTEVDMNKEEEEELKNIDSKSVILAPFNSTKTHLSSMHSSIYEILYPKNEVLRLNAKCRDVDRAYEINNNGELDNGVYNKFAKQSKENRGEEKKLSYGDESYLKSTETDPDEDEDK